MTKTRFLTWNIEGSNKKKSTALRGEVLAALVQEHDFEVIVLQEAPGIAIVEELKALGYQLVKQTELIPTGGVRIFLKKNTFQQLKVTRSDDRHKKLVAVELRRLTSKDSFNIAAVHLYSKKGRTEREQMWRNHEILRSLEVWEREEASNSRTILVGDFNANPYESNLRDPFLLRGQENRTLIQHFLKAPPTSAWLRNATGFWYNPMWHVLSDHNAGAPVGGNALRPVTGSYYWHNEGEGPFWNLYDGFMVRERLMHEVVHDEIEVLVRSGPTSNFKPTTEFIQPYKLTQNDSPILGLLPDHLPIKFAVTSL